MSQRKLVFFTSGVLLLFLIACSCIGTGASGLIVAETDITSTDDIIWACASPTPIPTTLKATTYYEKWQQEYPDLATIEAPAPPFPTPTRATFPPPTPQPTQTPLPWGSGEEPSVDCIDYCSETCNRTRDECGGDASTEGECKDRCYDAKDWCMDEDYPSSLCYAFRDGCIDQCEDEYDDMTDEERDDEDYEFDVGRACSEGEDECWVKHDDDNVCDPNDDSNWCADPQEWEREFWTPDGSPYGPPEAEPTQTPLPYGADGPVAEEVYWQEWEQEYPDLGVFIPPSTVGVFPAPTPYVVTGTAQHQGNRINLSPLNITTHATPTDTFTNGLQLHNVRLDLINHSTDPITTNLAVMVWIDAIKTLTGTVENPNGWRVSDASLELADRDSILAEILPESTSVITVPILAPEGTPEQIATMFTATFSGTETVPLTVTWSSPISPACVLPPGEILLP